jgi:hypothetical protein
MHIFLLKFIFKEKIDPLNSIFSILNILISIFLLVLFVVGYLNIFFSK